MASKPALVCLNNGAGTLSRYVPKNTGGFYRETFEIVNPEQCKASLTEDTIERFRLGQMRDQAVYPEAA